VIKQLVISIIASSLVACASTSESADPGPESSAGRASDCISQSSIRDYAVLDDSNLIVTEGVSRKYHMMLSRRAFGLKSSWRIAFRSPSGRICGGFDEIIVSDGVGGRPEAIRIDSIRRLSPEEEEDLLIRFGKKEPEVEQPRQPEAVEGAEVEELD